MDLLKIQESIKAEQFDLATRAENQAQRADKRDCEQ